MKKARVLVIDDEPSVVDAIKLILGDAGYDAVAATSGRSALEQAKRRNFDIAIIDLKLPDMSGLEAMFAIAERSPEIATILITAHDSDLARADAIAAGFSLFLAKPFSPATLLDAVQASLFHRRGTLRGTAPESS